MERRLAAILVFDVAGYSRLMGSDESGTLAALQACRREMIDPAISDRGGRIVNTAGDGALVEFASVVAAVECAVAIQQAMAARNQGEPAGGRLELRIGINLDEVIVDGHDIFGEGVNIAARLEATAAPGTICISGAAFDHVANRVDLAFEDLGARQLKNIAHPVRVFRIGPPAERFLFTDVRSICDELPLPDKPSIAVLPFANLTGDPAQDYLAEGVRLDIQAALVKASGLFLIGVGTTARYRGAEVTPEEAGRELGVRYVLEGTVRGGSGRRRIDVTLTDVNARRLLWAERYDRSDGDILEMQDTITAEVLKALDVKLASGEEWLLHRSLTSLEALASFYRGLSRFYAGTRRDNAEARALFEQVARLQPDSAVGPSYVSFAHWLDAFRGWTDSPGRSLAEAARWAEVAVRQRHSNGLAHIVLASIHLLRRRHEEALDYCYRAVALRPNCPTANAYLANVMHYCGRDTEAISKLKEAIRITPVYPHWYISLLAAAYRDSGRLMQSIAAAEHAVRANPKDLDPRLVLCSDHVLASRTSDARSQAQEILALDPAFSVSDYLAGQPYRNARTVQQLGESLRAAGLLG